MQSGVAIAQTTVRRDGMRCPECGATLEQAQEAAEGWTLPGKKTYGCGQCLHHLIPGTKHLHQTERVENLAVSMYAGAAASTPSAGYRASGLGPSIPGVRKACLPRELLRIMGGSAGPAAGDKRCRGSDPSMRIGAMPERGGGKSTGNAGCGQRWWRNLAGGSGMDFAVGERSETPSCSSMSACLRQRNTVPTPTRCTNDCPPAGMGRQGRRSEPQQGTAFPNGQPIPILIGPGQCRPAPPSATPLPSQKPAQTPATQQAPGRRSRC